LGRKGKSQLALVSRNSSQELSQGPPGSGILVREELKPHESFLLSPRELILADLELRPSPEGREDLVAFLNLTESGDSEKDYSYSRTALALSVKVGPRELPLLSGLIGRSFKASWRIPAQKRRNEELEEQNQLLQDKINHLRWLLKELAIQE